MKTLLAAALVAATPLVSVAQGSEPSGGAPAALPPAHDAPAPRPAPPRAVPPPPGPDATPPQEPTPPQGQDAPPPEYAGAPPGLHAPPPDDPAAYPPPPQRAPPAPPTAPRRRDRYARDSWYIGLGLNAGDGTVETSRGTSSFAGYARTWGVDRTPTTVGFNFKIGATLTPWLLVGFDLFALESVARDGDAATTLDIANYDLMATVFPFRHGLFLRGGVGSSALTFKVENAPTTTGTYSGSDSLSGWNAAAGVGYAFWIGRQFNLTANLDASEQWWNGHRTAQPRRSSCVAVGVGFDWY